MAAFGRESNRRRFENANFCLHIISVLGFIFQKSELKYTFLQEFIMFFVPRCV